MGGHVEGAPLRQLAELKLEGKIALAPPHRRRMPAFYLDPTEVTVQRFNEVLAAADLPEAPAAAGKPNHAAASVRWDLAAAWAERVGKRLPDEAEYEYAATNCGKSRFPWGDEIPKAQREKSWPFGPVGEPEQDRLKTLGQPDVCGLYSNVAEWTSSWPESYPGLDLPVPERARVTRGAPSSVVEGTRELREAPRGPRERYVVGIVQKHRGLGFRCARSAKPRWNAEDFVTVLGR